LLTNIANTLSLFSVSPIQTRYPVSWTLKAGTGGEAMRTIKAHLSTVGSSPARDRVPLGAALGASAVVAAFIWPLEILR
jgi:hypothetical protein